MAPTRYLSKAQITEIVESFARCLEPESLDVLGRLPPHTLKPEQRVALQTLSTLFPVQPPVTSDVTTPNDNTNSDDDFNTYNNGGGTNVVATPSSLKRPMPASWSAAGQKRGRPRLSDRNLPTPGTPSAQGAPLGQGTPSASAISTSGSWKSIIRAKRFPRPDFLTAVLDSAPTFNAAEYSGIHRTLDQIPTAETFPNICSEITAMAGSSKQDGPQERVVRLFHFLVMGEIASKLFGEAWDESLKGRDRMPKTLTREHGREYYDSVKGALKIANHLTFLCGEIGIGCIFWLFAELTDNFLEHWVSKSGEPFDNAKNHLQKHQLPLKIEESGANELGKQMKEHLIGIYRVGEINSDDDKEDSSVENSGLEGSGMEGSGVESSSSVEGGDVEDRVLKDSN